VVKPTSGQKLHRKEGVTNPPGTGGCGEERKRRFGVPVEQNKKAGFLSKKV